MPTVYVNASTGNDSNDGLTSATPYLTMNKAAVAAMTWSKTGATGRYIVKAAGTFIRDPFLVSANNTAASGLSFTGLAAGQFVSVEGATPADNLSGAEWKVPFIMRGDRLLTSSDVGTITDTGTNYTFTLAVGVRPGNAADFKFLGVYGTTSTGETRLCWFQRDTVDTNPAGASLTAAFRYTGSVVYFPKTGFASAPANTGLVAVNTSNNMFEVYGVDDPVCGFGLKDCAIVNGLGARGVVVGNASNLACENVSVDGCIQHGFTVSNSTEAIRSVTLTNCPVKGFWGDDVGNAVYAFFTAGTIDNILLRRTNQSMQVPRAANGNVLGKSGNATPIFLAYGTPSGPGVATNVRVEDCTIDWPYGFSGGNANYLPTYMVNTQLVSRFSNATDPANIRLPIKDVPSSHDVVFTRCTITGLCSWKLNRVNGGGAGYSAGPSVAFCNCSIDASNAPRVAAEVLGDTNAMFGAFCFDNGDRASAYLAFYNCDVRGNLGRNHTADGYNSPSLFFKNNILTNGKTAYLEKSGGFVFARSTRFVAYGAQGVALTNPCFFSANEYNSKNNADKLGWWLDLSNCELVHAHGPAGDPSNTQWARRIYPRLTDAADDRTDIGTEHKFEAGVFAGFATGYVIGATDANKAHAAFAGSVFNDAPVPTWQGAAAGMDVREIANYMTKLGGTNRIAAVGSSGGTLLDGTPVGPAGSSRRRIVPIG
jgi:hypothetical protein